MSRYSDISSGGHSRLVPYIPTEGDKKRHARRKQAANDTEEKLRSWCVGNGWSLAVKNKGHHLIMQKGNVRAEWWPSSAKLVFNKKWNRGIHCHDYHIVIEQLCRVTT